jgi:hypothetical protein
MARGKILDMGIDYPNVNITSHIIDRSSLKSFYLNVGGYFNLDYDELIKLRNKIGKTIVKNINNEFFYKERFISIEEIRIFGEWNYANYEYTIFFLKEDTMGINELTVETKRLMDIIYNTHFDKTEFNVKK